MIRLRALGGLELCGHDGEELAAVLAQPKRFAVLFYLATADSAFRRRDKLLDLFWRDTDQAHARAALNQAIYFLRQELGHEAVVSRGNDEVAVDADLLWCDALVFEKALDAGHREEALELYRGELLPGFFPSDAPGWERWLDAERDRLRGRAAAAAWESAEVALARREVAEAARWARHAVDIVPYDEVQLRRLLTLLGGIGDRTGAARAFDEAATRFAADYDGELSAATRSLAERIQAGELEEAHVAEDEGGSDVEVDPEAGAASGGEERVASTAPITAVAAGRSTGPIATDVPAGSRPPAGRRSVRAIAAGAVAAGAVAGALVGVGALPWIDAGGVPGTGSRAAYSTAPRGGDAAAIPSTAERLAVLPLTGSLEAGATTAGARDPDRIDVAGAMTHGLILRLSDLTGIGVIGQASVAAYRDARPPAAQIGRRLGARYLLEWHAEEWDATEGRIDVRVLEAGTGQTVWAHRYDAALADLSAVEGEIAVDVARALSIEIDTAQRRRLRDVGTDDAAARREYLKGRYALGKSDEASFRAALEHFRAAVDRDPAYADAWSGLSDAYDHLAGIGAVPSGEAYPRARAAAERALEIDPDLAEAHASLAMALSYHYWKSEDAERHWKRALELKPSDARARRTYAGHLRNRGRFEEALAQATVARDLDPLPFFSHFELLVTPYFQRRYEHVVESAEALANADPSYGYARFLRALALVQLERYDDALAALDEADPGGDWSDARLIRAYVAAHVGEEAVARRELRRLEQRQDPAAGGFERGVLHLALDEPDRAIAALEEAYDVRAFRLQLIGYEPLFDPLRGDPRFEDLVERMGLGEIRGAGDGG